MDNDVLLRNTDDFIAEINRVESITESGLRNTMFPDKVILSLHNHIGNSKHYISNETTAFNATEQFISITHALRELSEARDDLFKLKLQDIINELEFEKLNNFAYKLEELLRSAIDPEYA